MLTSVAPTPGGRTTRPCTIPSTRTLWTNSSCAGDQRRQVRTRHRRAEHRPIGGGLSFRRRIQRDRERLALDERAVGHAPGRLRGHRDHARIDRQPIAWHAEPIRRTLEQRLARRCRGERQIALVEIRRRRLASGRRALIRRDRRVALHQPDPIDRHRQLFRNQLELRRVDALSKLALAGVRRDPPVGRNRDPRLEPSRIHSRRALRALTSHERFKERAHRERHHERPGSFQKRPPRDSDPFVP